MNEAGQKFSYGGKSYQIVEDASGIVKVFRRKKAGLEPVHGVAAFRIVSAFRQKVEGKLPVRRPRSFANKPKKKRF